MGRKRDGRWDRQPESPDSRKRDFCTKRESSGLPCCFSQTGVSTMNRPRHNCTIEVTEEKANTNLHKVGVAIRKPSICVIIMPNTMASWVRTPISGNELGNINGKAKPVPTLPVMDNGAISARKTGPVHRPMPAPQPAKNLHASKWEDAVTIERGYCLPRSSRTVEGAMAIRAEPTATDSPLNWRAAFRPLRSMTMPAMELPRKPPTVNIDVTRENIASDIGMHVGNA